MREKLWKKYGTFVLAYPHPKQKKKLMADWQQDLLSLRPKDAHKDDEGKESASIHVYDERLV